MARVAVVEATSTGISVTCIVDRVRGNGVRERREAEDATSTSESTVNSGTPSADHLFYLRTNKKAITIIIIIVIIITVDIWFKSCCPVYSVQGR